MKTIIKHILYPVMQKVKLDPAGNILIITWVGWNTKKQCRILSNCTQETIDTIIKSEKLSGVQARDKILASKYPKLFKD